jgi:hypothetical protein
MARKRSGVFTNYSVYDARGRRLVGDVDREVASRVKSEAKAAGMSDVTLIRQGQEGKEPGPRSMEPR